ncbi:MAG: LysR family transcriptional regulator [Roseibium sp.]|uniref:LysR family transcriptional regulator n=1 Tax=Roseibium sp. TaxID=1936156 RepID=UPI00261169B9|nr:LysR family transcriptional regulator [Roseibium sp.]MCV0424144.1 LysR family transcriptional regulator [Roseibium sp.]
MTYRLPSLNTLRAFEAAARHLSFKYAATELGVTAGAVSQQVKKLETSLGVTLFRRLPHGLLLTSEGETYLPSITKVFEDLTRATELIAPSINSKKFMVGICNSIKPMLPANWPNHNENLHHHIRDWAETSDLELLRSNELDCMIRAAGGPYRDLALIVIPNVSSAEDLHFVCKPGLADCFQSKAIVRDLALHLN